ncbi:ArsR/SmtB family transcription factor [Phaeobacter gallaeciensis]|uniref:Transcriptional regulator, ArsR family n=1 Tax=Phaeobacter gallaeciensis TaxID=60890 RepID=A0AAD0EF20_9RHOB|nr:metalloregulator ArsR/SmtB family transcription factor [Phaeobacter gallaeciensis]AHD11932.1 transcriptional regulator, ArsR family [Phaeobacter gallaeciensis DSM 26640]ATE95198.1 transcriptional regulator, ArsR family [Phaeobacter gallaeciensis]ATE99589.1 transcriptional regulator, ArsR family [Phaeobacter gallaeciensis]ATF03903.1 transcriptional regulator, ArsR family [Phaeobacter gallaeciensis]ATF08179.1 transcriptional regulator, ArsR family [Phaeobacter gallaeciensis]
MAQAPQHPSATHPPDQPPEQLAEQMAFRALADPTRRRILRLLAQDSLTIAEVAENFQMTRAAVKKHLIILDEGNLISVRTEGRARLNRLNTDGLRQVFDWFGFFDAFWDDRLATLKSEIEKDIQ